MIADALDAVPQVEVDGRKLAALHLHELELHSAQLIPIRNSYQFAQLTIHSLRYHSEFDQQVTEC